jgi:hypothetical protein
MENKDVKEIQDIPNIENYLGYGFKFGTYSKDSEIASYSIENGIFDIEICVISDQNELFSDLFDNIITQENIQFLSFGIWKHGIKVEGYYYRPLVEEKDKNYLDN